MMMMMMMNYGDSDSDSDSGRHSGGRYGSVSSVPPSSSGKSDETPMRSASATATATSDRAGSDAADAPAPQDGRTREDDGGGGGGGVMTRPPVVGVSNSTTFDVDDGGKNAAEKSKDSMSCCQRTSLVLIAGACVRACVRASVCLCLVNGMKANSIHLLTLSHVGNNFVLYMI